ncbi:uncharacterized protein N0V89_008917 [Didymosphaeria variabile]|uniref:Uncharacterized protein n=1 Tax=Didymosphaeria variabile TaxID=1932322 RepID=A0A9W8XJ38_9PLEO|nr:uncharacterized protein N0V89_008917 [Didymosphaeria variabile]KAJ4350296.1 hypothetical protein N0V89_008917 [Didymosphaeria variabile]
MDEDTAMENSELSQLFKQMQDDGIEPTELLAQMAVQAYKEHIRTDKLDLIDAAVAMAAESVKRTPVSSDTLPTHLSIYGVMLASRYERTGNMADLEAAIQTAQQAINSAPDNHPDRAAWLNNLGNKLRSRYERTGDMVDLEKSGDSYSCAWKCENSIPFYRVQAAAQCVDVLGLLGKLNHAAELTGNAINLLPTISNRSLQRSN